MLCADTAQHTAYPGIRVVQYSGLQRWSYGGLQYFEVELERMILHTDRRDDGPLIILFEG